MPRETRGEGGRERRGETEGGRERMGEGRTKPHFITVTLLTFSAGPHQQRSLQVTLETNRSVQKTPGIGVTRPPHTEGELLKLTKHSLAFTRIRGESAGGIHFTLGLKRQSRGKR